MKSTITIGATDGGKSLKLDLMRLVDSRALIQANSGGGKSWLLRLIAEQAAGKVQTIILDPEGEFATLREAADLLLVSREGEIQPTVRAAKLLARKLVELNVSAVVDLYDLRLEERREFVRDFCDSLLSIPRESWHPLLVAIDECHLFAPERSAGESVATPSVIALASQGRKRGIGLIALTQRLSKLHKDAAAELNNVFIGRTWLPNDQVKCGDLMGMDKAERGVLRDLDPGQFFAFGPAIAANGVVRFTSAAVKTTHPKAGERHQVEPPKPSAAMRHIASELKDLPAQAETEIKDLAAARSRILLLERDLKAKPVAATDPQAVERAAAAAAGKVERQSVATIAKLKEGLEAAMKVIAEINTHGFEAAGIDPAEVQKAVAAAAQQIVKLAEQRVSRQQAKFDRLKKEAGKVLAGLQKLLADQGVKVRVDVKHNEPFTVESAAPPQRRVADSAAVATGELTKPQQAILDTVLMLESRGIAAGRDCVARWLSIHPNGGSYGVNLGHLRQHGYMAGFALTDLGRSTAQAQSTGVDAALAALPDDPKRMVVRALVDVGRPLTRDELAELLGLHPNGGSYGANLGWLRTMGLISPRGPIQPTDGLAR